MVRNLLENAVRHTPEKTTVELTARRDGDQALLEVLDDGPGIPAGIEEQVFDRFVRGDGPADTVGRRRQRTRPVRSSARSLQSHGGTVEAGRQHLRRRPLLDPPAARGRRGAAAGGPRSRRHLNGRKSFSKRSRTRPRFRDWTRHLAGGAKPHTPRRDPLRPRGPSVAPGGRPSLDRRGLLSSLEGAPSASACRRARVAPLRPRRRPAAPAGGGGASRRRTPRCRRAGPAGAGRSP